jgi:hypothetical protein
MDNRKMTLELSHEEAVVLRLLISKTCLLDSPLEIDDSDLMLDVRSRIREWLDNLQDVG